MVAQQVETLNHDFLDSIEGQVAAARAQLGSLEQWIAEAARDGVAAHEVERQLFDGVLRLGHSLFESFLKRVGPGDLGETATLDDGHVVPRLEAPHSRRLLTVFGAFDISRWVYAERDGQKIELAPTDHRLQLPASDLSYLLQEWDQMLGIEHAFGKVRDTLASVLRSKQSVDTLERTNRQMAEPILEFTSLNRRPNVPRMPNCWWSPRTTRACRWYENPRKSRSEPIVRKARKRTRSGWPAWAASTRWTGTSARRRTWWRPCSATRIGPA